MKANGIASQPKEGGGLRLFVVLVAILVIATGAILVTSDDDVKADPIQIGDLMYELDGSTDPKSATLTGFATGKESNTLTILDTVEYDGDTYNVTAVGDNAFEEKNITTLTIGNNVSTIGNGAFLHVPVTSITIPDNVRSIGEDAFDGCDKATKLIIGKGVTSIEKHAFTGLFLLEKIVFNATDLTKIGTYPFEWTGRDSGNLEVTFGNDISKIPKDLFSYNNGRHIKSVIIPNSITEIGEGAFRGSNISKLIIGENVKIIGKNAFYSCKSLSYLEYNATEVTSYTSSTFGNAFNSADSVTIKIGNNVTSIPAYFVKEITKPTTLIMGDNITSIGNNAFSGSTGLTGKLTIPDSVVTIGKNAFKNTAITEIVIGKGVKTIGESAYDGCKNISSIEYKATECTTIGPYAFRDAGQNDSFSVKFTDGVKIIPVKLFSGCTYLKEVEIGKDITTIGENSFDGTGISGTIVIPNTVTSIGQRAFYGCQYISLVEYNAPDAEVGTDAFGGVGESATGGFTVTFGDEVRTIPDGLFKGCPIVGKLTIPSSVTKIGGSAFYNCTSISTIEYNAANAELGINVFTNVGMSVVDGLTVTFGSSVEIIPANIFANNTYLKSITIGFNVTEIGSSAFNGCTGITGALVIPNSVTSIGSQAFYNCGEITSLTIPNSVTEIGSSAFALCAKLSSIEYDAIDPELGDGVFAYIGGGAEKGFTVTFGDSVQIIPAGLFYGNTYLKSITFGKNVTEIGDMTFTNCTGITSISMPDSVTIIGKQTFEGCNFKYVSIPDSVITIGEKAFYNNVQLDTVIIVGGVKSIGDLAFGKCPGIKNAAFGALPGDISVGNNVFSYETESNAVVNYIFKNLVTGTEYEFTQTNVKNGYLSDRIYGDSGTVGTLKMGYAIVTFDPNGGTGTVTILQTDSEGKLTQPLPDAPTREGHFFKGWFAGETQITPDTVFLKNMNITAKWIASHTVTFYTNGGSCDVVTMTTDVNEKIVGTLPTATREGFTFDGWYCNGEKVTQDTVFTQDSVVSAQWTAIPGPTPSGDDGFSFDWILLIVFIIAILVALYVAIVGRRKTD